MQDLFLNETAKFAHVFLPGTSFLEKDGTFTNAERRINRVRPVMTPATGKHEWEVACEIAAGDGLPDAPTTTPAEIMDEIAADSRPTFAGRVVRPPRQGRQRAVAVQRRSARNGTPIMHVGAFVRGKGQFVADRRTCPPTERTTRRFPLILTTGRILSQYNVGAQTRRTANVALAPGGRARDPPARRRGARHRRRRRGRAGQPGRRRPRCTPVIADRMPAGRRATRPSTTR